MTVVRLLVATSWLLLGSVAFGVESSAVGPACVEVDGVEEMRLRYASGDGLYVPAYLLIDSTYLVSSTFEEVGLRLGFDLLAGFLSIVGGGSIEGRIAVLHLDPCTLRAGYVNPLGNTGLLSRVGWTPAEVFEVLRWVDDYIRRFANYMGRSTLHSIVTADRESGEELALRAASEWQLLQEMRDDPFVSSPRLAASATAFHAWLDDDVRVVEALASHDEAVMIDVRAFRAAFDVALVAQPPVSPSLPFLRLPSERPGMVFIPDAWNPAPTVPWNLAPFLGDGSFFMPVHPNVVDRIDGIIGPITMP